MLSDFYLLHRLLRDQGRTQTWLTCLDPTNLVERYGEFAYGSIFRARKVVLDQNQRPNPLTVRVEEPEKLLPKFLEHLSTTCQLAKAANEPVLVCIFGHGDDLKHGVEIGGTDAEGHLLSIDDVFNVLKINEGINLCLFTKSCFSAGWAITPTLRNADSIRMATANMTAAGPDQPSESWPLTASLGRACGSTYISAIIKALEDETGEARDDGDTVMTTKEFGDAITAQLRDVIDPRFWQTHNIQSELQDDHCEDPYHKRTGIPNTEYRKRLDQLRTIPAQSFKNIISSNRSKTQTEFNERNKKNHPIAPHIAIAASNYGGSISAVKKAIRKKAIQYMQSHPGRDSLATNITEHAVIKKCISDPTTTTFPESAWSMVWSILHYRMTSIHIAETLLDRMKVKGPKEASKWDFDAWRWQQQQQQEAQTVDSEALQLRASKYYRLILDSAILPRRPHESAGGRSYAKPTWYLAVALVESG